MNTSFVSLSAIEPEAITVKGRFTSSHADLPDSKKRRTLPKGTYFPEEVMSIIKGFLIPDASYKHTRTLNKQLRPLIRCVKSMEYMRRCVIPLIEEVVFDRYFHNRYMFTLQEFNDENLLPSITLTYFFLHGSIYSTSQYGHENEDGDETESMSDEMDMPDTDINSYIDSMF